MNDLVSKHCLACEAGIPPLSSTKIHELLEKIPGWIVNETETKLTRRYQFKNFYHTMSFVNAVAFLANKENHHPDLEVGFNYCVIHYMTHAIQGLTENDFICAAKINLLTEA